MSERISMEQAKAKRQAMIAEHDIFWTARHIEAIEHELALLDKITSGEIVTAERQALEAMAKHGCFWGDCEYCLDRVDEKLEACASCTALHALGTIDNGEQP